MIIKQWILAIVLLGLVGCTPTELVTLSPTPHSSPTAISTNTEVPPTATPTLTYKPTATPTITLTPKPASISDEIPPPGLLYFLEANNGFSLWVVDKSGTPRQILARAASEVPDFDVSPDYSQLLFAMDGDIWLLDIATGAVQNVTNTATRFENFPRWWLGHDGFICSSFDTNKPVGLFGSPTYFPFNGVHVVLDNRQMTLIPAPQPNGNIMVYSLHNRDVVEQFDTLWEVEVGKGPQQIEYSSVNLSKYRMSIQSASDLLEVNGISWSNDGEQLSLALYGEFDGQAQEGIVAIDWQTKQETLLHVFFTEGIDMPFKSSTAKWASHSSWITFLAWSNVGIYVNQNGNTTNTTYPMPVANMLIDGPAISSDERWVAFIVYDEGVGLMRTNEWEPTVFPIQGTI